MKKIKKILAAVMTLAMVLGMSMTTFAATKDTATITILDEDGIAVEIFEAGTNEDGVELSYAPIIVPDRATVTGWAFAGNTSSDVVKDMRVTDAFVTAFTPDAGPTPSDQDVINTLIETQKDSDNIATSNTTQIAAALSTIAASGITYTTATTNPFQVTEAGVYIIKAAQEGYTYNTMAAYIGFGEVTIGDNEYEYPSLIDAEITAKRAPESVTKGSGDEDGAVAVDDIVTYTIEAYVPFIDPNDTDKTFGITDTIYGADYYLSGEGSVATVVMDGEDDPVATADDFIVTDGSFDIDLSELITADNANAGKKITVTYTAKVTGSKVNNSAASHVGDVRHDSNPVELITGEITLTKTDSEDPSLLLPGAGFNVTKAGSADLLTFTEIAVGDYVYDKEGVVTEVVTDENGKLVIRGLDAGTYNFKEITAPEGYHVKNDPSGVDASATLTVGDKNAEGVMFDEIGLTNTKLSSLPSTGGIGTTIFTVGGCIIMIAAAGLFFASRRKSSK